MKTITICTAGDSKGNPGPAAIGVQIVDAQGKVVKEVAEKIGNANVVFAEYQAVMRALQTVLELYGTEAATMQFTLKLSGEQVKRQLNSELPMTEAGLVPHFIEIHNLRVAELPQLTFTLVEQKANQEAYRLVHQALDA